MYGDDGENGESGIVMQKPVNSNAIAEAADLLEYLDKCVSDGKMVSGQHTQTIASEEIEYIRKHTGREPKLRGFEMLGYSPNINYDDASKECIDEVEDNKNTMDVALEWGKDKSHIVTLSFHWFSPLYGRDKSFYAKNTEYDARRVLLDGTLEREAFYKDLDVIAIQLKRFLVEKIPILWRPFHESDGDWFWWGAYGPEVAKELYLLMFDYYVNVHHLDNLLWVWNCADASGYPGDDYVDIISRDVYLSEYRATDYKREYEELVQATTNKKIAALAEIGTLMDIAILEESRVPWAYYMTWSKEWIIGEEHNSVDNLKKVYASDMVISL